MRCRCAGQRAFRVDPALVHLFQGVMGPVSFFRCWLVPDVFHPRGNPGNRSGAEWQQWSPHAHHRNSVCCGSWLPRRFDTRRHTERFSLLNECLTSGLRQKIHEPETNWSHSASLVIRQLCKCLMMMVYQVNQLECIFEKQHFSKLNNNLKKEKQMWEWSCNFRWIKS